MHDAAGLQERITRLFAERLHLLIPSPETDLFETGALDSMAFVQLLVEIEQEFGLTVMLGDIEMDNFRSIARIAVFVDAGRGDEAPAGTSANTGDDTEADARSEAGADAGAAGAGRRR